MRLSLFGRLPRSLPPKMALDRLLRLGWSGLDLHLNDLDMQTVELLQQHNLRMTVRVSSSGGEGDKSPASHVTRLQKQLSAVEELGQVAAHVVIEVDAATSSTWTSSECVDYLRSALPLGALLLERHPHLGESVRETDAFGSRPVHLHGVSHATARSDWGPPCMPVHEAADLYPIMRLSRDPGGDDGGDSRGAAWSAAGDSGVGDVTCLEHVDHLSLLHPSVSAAGAGTSGGAVAAADDDRYWSEVREVLSIKARRGAPEALVTLPLVEEGAAAAGEAALLVLQERVCEEFARANVYAFEKSE